MSEASGAGAPADGRPGAGAQLVGSMESEGQRRPKQRDLKPLRELIPFVRDHAGGALIAVFFLMLSTSASLGLTAASRIVVDEGFVSGSAAALNRTFLLLGLVALLLGAATGLRYYFVTRLGERVIADLRAKLYRHILSLDQASFLHIKTGEILSRLTTDIALLDGLLTSSASIALRNFLMMIGAFALLIFVSPRLTGFVVLLAPVVIAPMFVFGRSVRRLSIATQDRFAEAVGFAGESLDAIDTVQAFGREKSAADRFQAAVEAAFRVSLQRIGARAIMTGMVIVLVFGGVTLVLWAGAHSVIAGTMSVGQLIQFVFLSVMAAASVGALGEVWGDVQKASGAMARVAELLHAKPVIAAPPHPAPMPMPPRGEVAFDNVVFAYPGRDDMPALNGVSFQVSPGERVALVGPSGGGKSTVFRLLLRFYDPGAGAVRMDGLDLRDADPAEVRARIALVAQEASLFSGSALDNIRFGREGASEDEVHAAARAAEAEGFLAVLPQGLATPLGERAKTLSGGQRQRLAIARALVRDAPILLLDEATSALDAENERLVQKALDEAMSGRTTLVIAHRLATVLKADRILVMDQGRIVEQGTHAELSAKGGLYARLAKLQFTADAA